MSENNQSYNEYNAQIGEQRQQPPDEGQHHQQEYWQGVAWGSIPLLLFIAVITIMNLYSRYPILTSYGIIGLYASIIAYIILLITAIVMVCIPKRRFIGYGLLTMVFATPIIAAIGCIVILQPHY